MHLGGQFAGLSSLKLRDSGSHDCFVEKIWPQIIEPLGK